MSKAVSTVLSDFKPNKLQSAAIRRIREFQKELGTYGVQLRAAMELEFTVVDKDGIPQVGAINLEKAIEYIDNLSKSGMPHIQSFKTEGAAAQDDQKKATQYEITVDDSKGFPALAIGKYNFRPEEVAAITLHMKKHTIP